MKSMHEMASRYPTINHAERQGSILKRIGLLNDGCMSHDNSFEKLSLYAKIGVNGSIDFDAARQAFNSNDWESFFGLFEKGDIMAIYYENSGKLLLIAEK